jgi:hypothetical protein
MNEQENLMYTGEPRRTNTHDKSHTNAITTRPLIYIFSFCTNSHTVSPTEHLYSYLSSRALIYLLCMNSTSYIISCAPTTRTVQYVLCFSWSSGHRLLLILCLCLISHHSEYTESIRVSERYLNKNNNAINRNA